MPRSRLSSLDGSFLRVETPAAHMHVAWKGRFAVTDEARRPTLAALRRSIAARLDGAPRFRQRLAYPPGGLAEPVWVDDERFAVANHVGLLARAGEELPRARFDLICDGLLSLPLQRSRPLWEVHLAPRLDDGSAGLLMKIHHAMVDGKSAVELALLLLDMAPDAAWPAPAKEWAPDRAPGGARMALDVLVDAGGESLRAARGLARMATPRGGARIADTMRRTAMAVGEDLLTPAPPSFVNVPISPERTLVHHTAPLATLLTAKQQLGVTLNDVALAAVAGAMRSMAMQGGRLPAPLKVMVPVSTRAPEELADLGNRISFVFITLPVHLHRPEQRVAAIHEQTERFKRDRRAAGGEVLMGALGLLPEPLKDRAARLAASPKLYNLTVSNVPGPRFPVYLLGCELVEAVPVIPLTDGHALSVGIFSHRDRITFGGYADPLALPEVRDLPSALSAALLELEGMAARRRRGKAAAA